ncbi:unnamed protein product [Caenorhabditis bovis]|uniref:BLOC-1-related complex subunit 7 n=1 Tax=Caenorhabditis bovis TaxID=2654633 RepID=A0A8S1F2C9_9PELO|nr:unnamed protein product [Caenorhabditis bovis]
MNSVALESKTKLPQKILEVITDGQALAQLSIASSQTSEILNSSAKNLCNIEPSVKTTEELLESIDKIIDETQEAFPKVDNGYVL